MAFIDMGDQFIALSRGRHQRPDRDRHFGWWSMTEAMSASSLKRRARNFWAETFPISSIHGVTVSRLLNTAIFSLPIAERPARHGPAPPQD
ncbi:hypothetical protein [Aliirhizobium terrae]|uniref:hypothetical protein n=1 Tax=Terrirhizobium terrae TaxID=2926709 RepID=UPI003369DDCB